MRRLIAAILAIATGLNGLAMLVAGPLWHQTVPGASETGPFNPHFAQDTGAASLVAGLPRGHGGQGTGRPPSRAPASSPSTPCSTW